MASKFSYDQPYIIVGALIERDGKFLVLQENHEPNKGLWNLPSGKLDFGEAPLDGVRREVKEEAGLDFEPTAIVAITSMYRRDVGPEQSGQVHALRIMYTGHVSGEVTLEHGESNTAGDAEIAQAKWLTPEQINDPQQTPLRYGDIPRGISNLQSGRTLPLDALTHLIQNPTTKPTL